VSGRWRKNVSSSSCSATYGTLWGEPERSVKRM